MPRLSIFALLFPFLSATAQEVPLYNGPEYTAYYKGTLGHPYFLSDTALTGDLLYDGILYRDAGLAYNLTDELLYVRDPQGYNVQLITDRIGYFSLRGHRFVRLTHSVAGAEGFHELLYDGNVKVYAKRIKRLRPSFRPEDPMRFIPDSQYLVYHNGSFHVANNLAEAKAAFGSRKADIQNYFKQSRLHFRQQPERSLLAIAAYIESTTAWPKKEPRQRVNQTAIVPADSVPQATRKFPKKDSLAHPEANLSGNLQEQRTALVENRLFDIGGSPTASAKGRFSLAGYVKQANTGETIPGATLSVDGSTSVVTTDQFGYYSIDLPAGRHLLRISAAGMKATRRQLNVTGNGKLDIDMEELVRSLKAVLVVAEKNSNVRSTQMSVERLSIKTIRQVPVVFGEADVLRVVMTLPGVSSAGEASTGFNVRGGSVDQNLILFNEATIYNPSHVFGFFSAFNPDLVKTVELYKSAIPEKFGGRLSSVLDVTGREGNNKKLAGTGGIGPLTSKLTIEGPVRWSSSAKGDRHVTTFIAGARTTYSNWLLRALPDEKYRNSRASFYDVNLNISHTFDRKNSLYATGYLSNDKFRLNNDTGYAYGNRNGNLKWKHVFNNKLYGVFTAGYDNYHFAVETESETVNSFKLNFDINQAHFRSSFSYAPSNTHAIDAGLNTVYYTLHPGAFNPSGSNSLVLPDKLQTEQALETGLYIGDKYSITPNLSLNAGIRYSIFQYLGPYDVQTYAPGIPRDSGTITGVVSYGRNSVIKTYHSPEYRVSARYAISDNSSFKMSFNTTRQYIHMLSNTTIISPTDTWKLSDADIKPQRGTQFSAGYYRNFRSNAIETSVELYFKRMNNVLDYKSGARLIMNKYIAADVINAEGKSYGAELMLKKVSGKLNGWISYTWSRTLLKQNDTLAGEQINRGEYYPASFDRPHNLNVIANYRFTHRFSLSVNLVYTTGRPVTIPIAVFDQGGSQRVYYSERNQYRVPDYFRTDLSFTLEGNHKLKQKTHNSWSFGVYNLTARKNPYSVYFTQEEGVIRGYQLSIFGTVLPFVTYNFRF